MVSRSLLALAVGMVLLCARPALPQSPTATPLPTPTPSVGFGWDPVRATLHAAFAQATPASPTPTPGTLRAYPPLLLTLQAWWLNRPPATEAPCGWMWASQPLTELTARVQAAINTAGAETVTFEASAYGENCLEPDGQTVRSFISRDVVFRLHAAGSDAAIMGDALALALPVVQLKVKIQSRPLAEISILFPDADLDPIRLTPAMLDRALAQEAGGAALVARLYAVSLR